MGARDRALWINDRRLTGRGANQYPSHTFDSTNRVTSLDRTLVQMILDKLGSPALSISLWNGETFTPEQVQEETAKLRFHDRGVMYQLIRNAELYFGDLVASGRLDIDSDWVSFFEIVYRSMRQTRETDNYAKKLYQSLRSYIPQTNTLATAKSRIYHHYDISNDF